MGPNLGSLEDRLRFEVLVVSRVLNVRLNPADVFTAPEAPLLQTLHHVTARSHTILSVVLTSHH